MNHLKRRLFLKHASLLAFLTMTGSLFAEIARAAVKIPEKYKLATQADQIPKAMQYTDDAAKTNSPTRTDKKAFCSSCALYGVTVKEFKHPTDGKVATCETFAVDEKTKLFVKAGGWCLAYQAKKA